MGCDGSNSVSLKIAFATVSDSKDIRRGSGTFYSLAQEIERQGHNLVRVGPIELRCPVITRVVHRFHRWLGKRHPIFLDPFVGGLTGEKVAQQLADREYGVLLTNDMSIAAFTPTSRPIVIYTDVMIRPDYPERDLPGCRLGNMSTLTLGLCRRTLRRALRRSALAVFPAEWSARAARSYCRDANKVKVVPFGANVADPGPEISHGRSWEKVSGQRCFELLFVGKDWIRKGGEIAVETVRCLNASGIRAKLHVVGARVPGEVAPEQVQQHGLLDKSKPGEMQLLKRLFTEANAFILPSSSEGYVISVLEAAAFGLPTLAYDTDGVRDAVLDGGTGLLFPLGSSAEVFVDAVRSWQRHPAAYDSLVRGARQHYETSINWRACVGALIGAIEEVLPVPACPRPRDAIPAVQARM
jgi:glycosyltransferase involved in cell wall biosynthesis